MDRDAVETGAARWPARVTVGRGHTALRDRRTLDCWYGPGTGQPPERRRAGDPDRSSAGSTRIGAGLDRRPRFDDRNTIVRDAFAWDQRPAERRA
jgi:hypothetical protein